MMDWLVISQDKSSGLALSCDWDELADPEWHPNTVLFIKDKIIIDEDPTIRWVYLHKSLIDEVT